MSTVGGKPRVPLPPFVRRLARWFDVFLWWSLALVVAFGLRYAHPSAGPASRWLTLGLFAASPAIMLVTVWMVLRGYRRIKRVVVVASGHACVHCAHDLNGLGEAGLCPECGRAFDIATDLRSWARVYMLK